MNHCGVGDFMGFIQGLQKVRNEIYDPERKLVINCSWILEMPCDDFHCRHANQVGDPDTDFERAVLEFSKSDQNTPLMLEFLFNQFYALGRQAIAAAGNDDRMGHERQIASRYPAALENVTEVEASPKTTQKKNDGKFRINAYSKPINRPKSKVVIPFGGQEAEEEGILGVYIGELPGGSPNMSKWAWWSGTSFATPVLTGAVAAVLSSSDQINTTQEAIEKLYDSEIIFAAQTNVTLEATEADEDVLAVIQN
jgi:hypothetical protein